MAAVSSPAKVELAQVLASRAAMSIALSFSSNSGSIFIHILRKRLAIERAFGSTNKIASRLEYPVGFVHGIIYPGLEMVETSDNHDAIEGVIAKAVIEKRCTNGVTVGPPDLEGLYHFRGNVDADNPCTRVKEKFRRLPRPAHRIEDTSAFEFDAFHHGVVHELPAIFPAPEIVVPLISGGDQVVNAVFACRRMRSSCVCLRCSFTLNRL